MPDKNRPIKPMVDVTFYSKKKPFQRRQWYWRAFYNRPGILYGKVLAIGGEGYNNLRDAMNSFNTVQFHLPFAKTSCPENDLEELP